MEDLAAAHDLNDGADTPFCVVAGCACNSSGLCGVRAKPKQPVLGCFSQGFCKLITLVLNVFMTPFMLAINWCRIFALPCLLATIHLALARFCCFILGCRKVCPKYRHLEESSLCLPALRGRG